MAAPKIIQTGQFEQVKQQTSPLAGHIATRQSAGELVGMFNLLPNPDTILRALGKSIEVYRDLKSEAIIKGLVARREGAVKTLERGFDKGQAKTRLAKNMQAIFDDLDHNRIIEEGMDGAFFGYAVYEVIWGKVGNLVVPVDLVAKPQEWFGFDANNALMFRPRASISGQAVPERKFIVLGKKRTYKNPYGDPDFAACFWPVTFKRGGLKFWVRFTEKYGMPWAVGKQPRQTSQTETEAFADRLAAMIQDAVAVIPDDSSVEMLTVTSAANADLYERLLMFCRSDCSIALLGNNQTVEMDSNKASSEAGAKVEHYIREADAQMIAGAYNQLAKWVGELNYGSADLPVWEFWEQEEVDDVLAKRDEILTRAGVKFTPEYFKRTYKLEDGDLDTTPDPRPAAPAQRTNVRGAQVQGNGDPAEEFAEGDLAADQQALDDAIAQLDGAQIQAAMKTMLTPALKAIEDAATPDEVRQALADAWPDMDTAALQKLMEQAYFVADVLGRDSVMKEAS